MTNAEKKAIAAALRQARQLVAYLEASLGVEDDDPVIPLKQAAYELGITEEAARKRAKRGRGVKLPNGRIGFHQSYLDGSRQAHLSR